MNLRPAGEVEAAAGLLLAICISYLAPFLTGNFLGPKADVLFT